VRFTRIEAISVGRLADAHLDLAPGMTVVHGPNEAGKSTWHAALLAGWVGLRRGLGRMRGEDEAFRDRHTPWDGRPLVAAVEVETDDGVRYRFRHNLTDLHDHRATDGAGSDVTDRFVHEQVVDGARLLGLTRETVRATMVVGQADILRVAAGPSEELTAALQAAAATAGAGSGTVAEAIARIDAHRSQHVGSLRAGSSRPLRVATDEVDAARAALAEARRAHEARAHLRVQRDAAASRAEALADDLADLRRGIAAAEAERARTRLEALERLAREADTSGLATPAPDAQRERVRAARHAAATPVDDGHVAEREAEVDRLRRELAGLPEAPTHETVEAPEVRAAAEDLVTARLRADAVVEEAPEPVDAPEVGDLDAAALEELARVLDGTPPEVPAALREELAAAEAVLADRAGGGLLTALGVAGVLLLVIGVVLAAAGAVPAAVAAAVAGVAGLGVAVAGRGAGPGADAVARLADARAQLELAEASVRRVLTQRAAAEERLAAAGVPTVDPTGLRVLARRVRAAAEQEQARRSHEDRRRERTAAVARAEDRLRGVLESRGCDTDGRSVDEVLADYRAACERAAGAAAGSARRGDLEARLHAAERELPTLRDAAARHEQALATLAEVAAEVGITASLDDPDALDAAVAAWLDGQRVLDEAHAAAETARQRLADGLAGRTLDEVRADVAAATAAVGDVAPVPDLHAALEDLRALEHDVREAEGRAAELQGQVAAFDADGDGVAGAEERVAAAVARRDRLERLDRTLETTRELLARAEQRVHQDVAPVLERAVATRLPQLTGGRHGDVRVVPATLEVQVRTEGGRYRRAQDLSHGTAEQVYLLLRVALAEHLVTTGETAPLVLDDPTVHADATRTRALLDLLRSLAEDGRQVLVFSQETAVRDWAAEHLVGDPRHALVDLDAATGSAVPALPAAAAASPD
jgi:hypothetical protein